MEQEILEIIDDIQNLKSELDYVEVKAAKKGCPRVRDTLSSFSNQAGGGIILFGIDENYDYKIVGVYDVDDLQKRIMHQSKDMEPEVRVQFVVEQIDDKKVVAAIVPECPKPLKPCYIKTKGLNKGSYIRVGDSDERMTDYEVHNMIVSRGRAVDDMDIVEKATMDDLDMEAVEKHLTLVKKTKPRVMKYAKSKEDIVKKLNIIGKVNGEWKPTIAGLLVFGKYPQEFFPSLVVTFLVLPAKEMGVTGTRGERFLDNKKIEGTIQEIIEGTEQLIVKNMKNSTIVKGLIREDKEEYPEDAIREAVRNALVHRDYSEFMCDSYVQVRMFPDRLEIENPGTLYGDVSIDTLEHQTATRNSAIMTLLEDLKIIENRGSGIDTMIHSMRQSHLEPPKFRETRSSFSVTFKNHNLLDQEALDWLSQFSNPVLTDHQCAALVYIRNNGRITNREYQFLNSVDSVTATKDLKQMIPTKVIKQHGTRGGAYYTLSEEPNQIRRNPFEKELNQTEKEVIRYIKENGSISNKECRLLLGFSDSQFHKAKWIFDKLTKKDLILPVGEKRFRKYVLKSKQE